MAGVGNHARMELCSIGMKGSVFVSYEQAMLARWPNLGSANRGIGRGRLPEGACVNLYNYY